MLRVALRTISTDGLDLLALMAVVWLLVEAALAATSIFSWRQYYFMWLLPMTMLLALGTRQLVLRIRNASSARRRPASFAVGVGAAFIVLTGAGLPISTATALKDLGGSVLHFRDYRSTPSETERLARTSGSARPRTTTS